MDLYQQYRLRNIFVLREMSKEELLEYVEEIQDTLEEIDEEWRDEYSALEKMYDKLNEEKEDYEDEKEKELDKLQYEIETQASKINDLLLELEQKDRELTELSDELIVLRLEKKEENV